LASAAAVRPQRNEVRVVADRQRDAPGAPIRFRLLRSVREETKFHQRYRGPIGWPPSSMRVAGSMAFSSGHRAGREHDHLPVLIRCAFDLSS
jgi:hypothetical protein